MTRKVLLLMALIPLAACNKGKDASAAQPVGAAAPAAQAPGFKGTVLERLDAAPYTYLRLKTVQGEIWTAVPTTDAPVGSEVSFIQSMEQLNWDSPKLKRKFDRIFLGTLAQAGPAPAGAMGAAPAGHPPVAAPSATVEIGKIAKFEGSEGRTVAEIFAQRTALAGKTVAVRGRVMKVSFGITVAGIAGANWVHLQDGSGNSAKADHDLTVTTDDQVAVGDLVVAKGTLQADPKIGSGYERVLLMQGAKIIK